MIEFRVFGSVALMGEDGGEILSVLAQPKRIALLAYLAVARPRAFHRRDELTGLFWPESDQRQARDALRRSVYVLRRSLGQDVILSRGREEVGLSWERIWCDARELDEALGEGDEEMATNLYRGDLLPAFFLTGCPDFERWLERERGRFQEATAAAAWTLAHRWVEMGLVAEGIRMGFRALGMVATNEVEVRRFLCSLVRAENSAGAIRFYERFANGIRKAFDMEPSGETRALVEEIRLGQGDGDGAEAPS